MMTSALPDLPRAVENVLGDYLRRQGFVQTSVEQSRVEFLCATVVISLSYYPEDPPPRGLNTGIGIRQGDGSRRTVGMWALIPAGEMAGRYSQWRFSSDPELESTLVRLRDEVIDLFAAPFWREPRLLVDVVDQEELQREQMYEADLDQRHLRAARRAFEAGDFRLAIDSYALASDRLSKVDEKRLKVARAAIEPRR
jgi:hypothetical protein